jgi:hypothetical protein
MCLIDTVYQGTVILCDTCIQNQCYLFCYSYNESDYNETSLFDPRQKLLISACLAFLLCLAGA